MPPTRTAFALSGVSIVRTTGCVALNGSGTRAYADGLVHESQATLYAARSADWVHGAAAVLAALASRLGITPPAL